MSLTAPQRAAVLTAIQAAAAAHPDIRIRNAVITQTTRVDYPGATGVNAGGEAPITTIKWTITVGRVTFEIDEQLTDTQTTDVTGRFGGAGTLSRLLADRLANP